MRSELIEGMVADIEHLKSQVAKLETLEGDVSGSGTAGRLAEWATSTTLQASTLAKTGAGVLTLSAAGAYTTTIPATGTVALLDYANAPVTGFGIGIAPTASTYFHVSYANNTTAGTLSAAKILMLHTPGGASSAAAVGLFIYAEGTGNQNITGGIVGLFGQAVYSGSATLATIYGLSYGVNVSVGIATIASGIDIYVNKSSGTIGTATGINIQSITSGTTNYSIKTGLGTAQFGDTTRIIDNTTSAIGVGGKLEFYGAYTGTSTTIAAKINAAKSNGVAGEWGFDLAFHTRLNGSGAVSERMRIYGDGMLVINDLGVNTADVRMEGNSLAYMFFIDATAATENIALLTTAAPNWQTMDRGLFIGDSSTAPTGNPAAGGFLYVVAGALTWRGSGGTVTTMGPAEPHCPRCGRDYVLQWENDKWEKLAICMHCLSKTMERLGVEREEFLC